MKYTTLFTILSIFLLISCGQKQQDSVIKDTAVMSTYYFIRHAEKDRSDSLNQNPQLSNEGYERAERWNQVFKNITFDAVYSTDFNRTKETAQPTAIKNELQLTIYDPKTLDVSNFLSMTKGKNILVVGHSNTIPTLVNAILGSEKYKAIDDSNNANLYIITLSGDLKSDTVLEIN
ncbi:phosphoglycerate mutase family protein [Yeosuana sp.]|uniref:phosphoglycerate mutase family protein n=1 Tax=Yeosuana sp. TaxID=2529388 RepID=UPI004054B00B